MRPRCVELARVLKRTGSFYCHWCAAFHKQAGRIINRLTVREVLDEEQVRKV